MSEEHENWLDALAGRVSPEMDDVMTARLRAALKAREGLLRGDMSGFNSLISKLESESLVKPAGAGAPRRWAPLAMAASVVTVALVAGLLMVDRGDPLPGAEPVRYRGFGTVIQVPATDPADWAARLERALDRAGCAHSRGDGEGDGIVVVVDAAGDCLAPLNRLLGEHGLGADAPGRYRLVVNPTR